MRESSGCATRTSCARTGSTHRARVERSRRRRARADRDALAGRARRSSASAPTRSRAEPFVVHTWNDLLGVFPGLIGVKTGHTDDAGWCQVAAARRRGFTIYAVILGSPTRGQRNVDLNAAARLGRVAVPHVDARRRDSRTRGPRLPYGLQRVPLVAREAARARRSRGAAARRADRRADAVSLPVARASAWGAIEVWAGKTLLGTRPLARGSRGPATGSRRTATVVRAREPCIIWSGSSRDRHRHPQRGSRPHADGAELPARPPASRERQPHARQAAKASTSRAR